MKACIRGMLIAWLMTGFTFLSVTKVFSQTSQQANTNKADSSKAFQDKSSAYVKGITAGRARALVGVASGLASLIIGVIAKKRSAKQAAPGKGKSGAVVALILGLTGIILGIVHLSTSAGAVFGSGSGKAGAIFGLLLGATGIIFGLITFRRPN